MPLGGGAGVQGEEYVERVDPSATDFTQADLTLDGTWRDLDLSSIVTDSDAIAVHIFFAIKDGVADKAIKLRKNGYSNAVGVTALRTQTANVNMQLRDRVQCDSGQVVEYNVTSGTDNVWLTVVGWWKPV